VSGRGARVTGHGTRGRGYATWIKDHGPETCHGVSAWLQCGRCGGSASVRAWTGSTSRRRAKLTTATRWNPMNHVSEWSTPELVIHSGKGALLHSDRSGVDDVGGDMAPESLTSHVRLPPGRLAGHRSVHGAAVQWRPEQVPLLPRREPLGECGAAARSRNFACSSRSRVLLCCAAPQIAPHDRRRW
jgi:hypothetical protein